MHHQVFQNGASCSKIGAALLIHALRSNLLRMMAIAHPLRSPSPDAQNFLMGGQGGFWVESCQIIHCIIFSKAMKKLVKKGFGIFNYKL